MGMIGSGGDSLVAQLQLAAAPSETRATCDNASSTAK